MKDNISCGLSAGGKSSSWMYSNFFNKSQKKRREELNRIYFLPVLSSVGSQKFLMSPSSGWVQEKKINTLGDRHRRFISSPDKRDSYWMKA
jgi:hypothetical protein